MHTPAQKKSFFIVAKIDKTPKTKLSDVKNQLPTPFNIVYSGTMCCVHNGIIAEEDLDKYKKEEVPRIFEKMKEVFGSEKFEGAKAEDIQFVEEGSLNE